MEYNSLIDQAIQEKDSIRRLAFIAAHNIASYTNLERSSSKPFNPMLGETYELVTD